MTNVFGIVGWSGSGKTDLTTRIINYFVKKNILVASIKHTHHNFEVDKKGKDSNQHMKAGSNEVIIFNENKWALISKYQNERVGIEKIIDKFEKKTEIILVEGLKHSSFPKIEVIRTNQNNPFIYKEDNNIKALVVDDESKEFYEDTLPVFKFSNTNLIGDFIWRFFNNE
ncbi:MAG: molybdopterin-guanine dinucleotide biosynthesis protein B [Pelagibacteraceae bacterium TMED65]|nr:molybdopterin-guanine dinucleotide biosynthesis protein B [Rickettsiales bacterium]OUU51081.1 MAG: molybdopterin-guanine dinucleotide biosynthesis protein B [Pelagibacteraceae bacterium TMED65]|tara:strand:- start:1056 stop:1565 length:510 start_codon:yes stop_codon:yes gene_type:complete